MLNEAGAIALDLRQLVEEARAEMEAAAAVDPALTRRVEDLKRLVMQASAEQAVLSREVEEKIALLQQQQLHLQQERMALEGTVAPNKSHTVLTMERISRATTQALAGRIPL